MAGTSSSSPRNIATPCPPTAPWSCATQVAGPFTATSRRRPRHDAPVRRELAAPCAHLLRRGDRAARALAPVHKRAPPGRSRDLARRGVDLRSRGAPARQALVAIGRLPFAAAALLRHFAFPFAHLLERVVHSRVL